MTRLTVRQLSYFDALAQTLHFGRAAELAGVSQPALSAQIRELEEKLGCRLFTRGARSVSLTEEATALRPRIEAILAQLRELETAAHQERRALQGRFRLGVIPTVAPYLLPALLPELTSRFPGLTVELREAVTATLVEETAMGRLDGMIAALPLENRMLEMEVLSDDPFYLAVPGHWREPAAARVSPEHPVFEQLMLLEEGHCLRDQALAACGSGRPAALANYGATSLTTLLQMVAHGQGVTLIPRMALAAGISAGLRIVPLAEPAPSRRLALAWRRSSDRVDEARRLAEVVRSLAGPLASSPAC
jgi:LysR family hydrogen peroxide-inducible transcriptional activator